MKKELIAKLTVLALVGTIGTTALAPSLTASASVVDGSSINSFDNNKTITIEGIEYNLNDIADSIRADINYDIDYNGENQERSAATKAIKVAINWLKSNWTKVYNKLPSWAKKYFKFDFFFSVCDQFIAISDSVQDFLNNVFRRMGMPENVNWAITNVIMLLLPI